MKFVGNCKHCDQPISQDDSGKWIHGRYSLTANDDLAQCLLYATPKDA